MVRIHTIVNAEDPVTGSFMDWYGWRKNPSEEQLWKETLPENRHTMYTHHSSAMLEHQFGTGCVLFNSMQSAVRSLLETLEYPTVLLSVASEPDIFHGVLGSESDSVIVDIDPVTLQMQPEVLRDALKVVPDPLVCLHRPFGQEIDPRLLEVVDGFPVVMDNDMLPPGDMEVGQFALHPLRALTGSTMTCLFTHHGAQIRDLLDIVQRDGLHVSEIECLIAKQRMEKNGIFQYRRECQAVVQEYLRHFAGDVHPFFLHSREWTSYPIHVKNAGAIRSNLSLEGLKAFGMMPLHRHPKFKHAFPDTTMFQGINSLLDKILCLVVHPQMKEFIPEIVQTVKELNQ